MANEKDRATQRRETGDDRGKKRPYVMLVPGTRGGFEGVIVYPPDEITFEDESPITPSRDFRNQEVRQQAESVLSKAAKGQHFKDDYLDKLEKQLRKSGDKSSKDLVGAVGQLRASQHVRDEARMTAPANRGSTAATQSVQQPAQSKARSLEPLTAPTPAEAPEEEAIPGVDLKTLAGIGLVRQQWEARGLTNRFARGEQISARDARLAAERLVGAQRQAGVIGLQSGDVGQLISLGEIQVSQLQKAIADVEGRESKGGPAGGKELIYLGQSALGMERQYQLLGAEGELGGGMQLAIRLGEIKRTRTENEIKAVLDKAKRNELSGEAYVAYLMQNLLSAERQDQLFGKGSPERVLELANSLGKLPRVPLSQEARQVIDGLKKGRNLDDEYVEFLRRRLVEDSERRRSSQSRELAEELREEQVSRLEAEVRTVLEDAKSGKRFTEYYLTYLQKHLGEKEAEDKDTDRKSRWKKLARELDDLIGKIS